MGKYLSDSKKNTFLSIKLWKSRDVCLTFLYANPRTVLGIK